jgi:hypothetical protein
LVVAVSAARGKRSSVELLSGSSALEHIRFLASDELGGRGNGSEGLDEAADYVASQFERLGLRPGGGDESFFQPFEVTLGGVLGSDNAMRFASEPELRLHRDFEPMSFSGVGEVEAAPVVFVGYGITAPEHSYDDYSGINARGKAVMLLRHTPREKGDGPFDPQRGHATFVTKVVNAKSHGATAVLVVTDPINHRGEPDELVEFGKDLGAHDLGIPAVHLKQEVAERLFEREGKALSAVQEGIDEGLRPESFELTGARVSLTIDIQRKRREVRNVLGYLAPEGASGEEELLVIGAHYDHLAVFTMAPTTMPPAPRGLSSWLEFFLKTKRIFNAGSCLPLSPARSWASWAPAITRGIRHSPWSAPLPCSTWT